MSATLTQSDNRAILTLQDDLTLPHADEMKNVFRQAVTEADDITIEFRNVGVVDLSCLQLFCSAHRSAVRMKKRIGLGSAAPPAFRQAMAEAGFSRLKGCKPECENSCLWAAAEG